MCEQIHEIAKKIIVATFFIIIGSLALFFLAGLIFETYEKLAQKDFTFFLNYAEIMLTLFTGTFIGTLIFEKYKPAEKEYIKKLFWLNILFLASGISFLFLHAIVHYKQLCTGSKTQVIWLNVSLDWFCNNITVHLFNISIFITYIVALVGLVWGSIDLFLFLWKKYKEI